MYHCDLYNECRGSLDAYQPNTMPIGDKRKYTSFDLLVHLNRPVITHVVGNNNSHVASSLNTCLEQCKDDLEDLKKCSAWDIDSDCMLQKMEEFHGLIEALSNEAEDALDHEREGLTAFNEKTDTDSRATPAEVLEPFIELDNIRNGTRIWLDGKSDKEQEENIKYQYGDDMTRDNFLTRFMKPKAKPAPGKFAKYAPFVTSAIGPVPVHTVHPNTQVHGRFRVADVPVSEHNADISSMLRTSGAAEIQTTESLRCNETPSSLS